MGKHNGRIRMSKDGLGKALSNKQKGKGTKTVRDKTFEPDQNHVNYQSVIERNDLDELLEMADLAGRDFVAERSQIRVISTGAVDAAEQARAAAQREAAYRRYAHQLKIPRRPKWDENTTKRQLDAMEKASFLEWRRNMARLEEEEGLLMTPFEKNLEVWRQLWRVLERSDVVVQVVDAREPLTYRCPDLEAYCSEIFHSKRSMLLLNKADLLNAYERSVWADYFEEQGISYIFWSAFKDLERTLEEKKAFSGLIQKEMTEEEKEEQAAVIVDPRIKLLTSDQLLQKLEEFAAAAVTQGDQQEYWKSRNQSILSDDATDVESEQFVDDTDDTERRLIVGLVGYPNVGKSSSINALYGSKKTAVHSTPGKTKHFQTLNVTEKLTFCDCPGLVFPKFATSKAEIVAAGVIPIDKLTDVRAPIEVIAQKIPKQVFEEIYNFKFPPRPKNVDSSGPVTAVELLRVVAWSRGWNASSGLPDEFKTGRIILKDYVNGKIPHCDMPPGWVQSDEEDDSDEDDDENEVEDEEEDEIDVAEHEENVDKPEIITEPSNKTPQSKFSFSFSQSLQSSSSTNTTANINNELDQIIKENPTNKEDTTEILQTNDADDILDHKQIDKQIADIDDPHMLEILSIDSKVQKPRRASHKFQKKPSRSKPSRGGRSAEDGDYDGTAFVVGKKGGIVGVSGYTPAKK